MALSNSGVEDWMKRNEMKTFFLSVLCSNSQLVCSTVFLKFLKDTPELSLSHLVFFVDGYLIVDLYRDTEIGVVLKMLFL